MGTKPDWRVGLKGNGRAELEKVGKDNCFQGFFYKEEEKNEVIAGWGWECRVKESFFFF